MIATKRLLSPVLAIAGLAIIAGSASAQVAKPASHHAAANAKLRAEAKIDEATARTTALKEVPNGVVQSSELEREKGKLIYSFDIKAPNKSGIEEVNVDAVSGAVLAHEHETAAKEKREAAQEAKEAKAAKAHPKP
jgi:uncharacterized membrane protein YkoI